jgi:hypothetical protein
VIATGDVAMFHSPSLQTLDRSVGPAYELKFLIDAATAAAVQAWARQRLAFDPHGDPARDGAYHTTTLYLDTEALDVYHRAPSFRRRKFRVRRYGDNAWVYLERKTKAGDRVTKRRVQVEGSEVSRLAGDNVDAAWTGMWFHQRIAVRRLQPAMLIAYDRIACVGTCAEGPLRLTIDRDVHGVPVADWAIDGGVNGHSRSVLANQTILELKFLRALPLPFKDLVRDFSLSPTIVSKYRLCREAWGVPAVAGNGAARA